MTCPYASTPGAPDPASLNSLVEHCRFFAHQDGPKEGKITRESLNTSLESLGIPSVKSRVMSVALMVLLSANCGHVLPVSELDPREVAIQALHSCSTRVFSHEEGSEGEFDPVEWERFKGFDTDGSGALTEADMANMRVTNRRRSKLEKEAGCIARFVDAQFSSGEFSMLFTIGADTEKDGQPAISIERWEEFYRDGAAVFQQIANARENTVE